MATTITLTLTGAIAERAVRQLAMDYVTFTINSTLDGRFMWNSPARRGDFKGWRKEQERRRLECRDALKLLLAVDPLPPVTIPGWRMTELTEGCNQKWDGKGKFDPSKNWRGTGEFLPSYSIQTVREQGTAYADQVWAAVTAAAT